MGIMKASWFPKWDVGAPWRLLDKDPGDTQKNEEYHDFTVMSVKDWTERDYKSLTLLTGKSSV